MTLPWPTACREGNLHLRGPVRRLSAPLLVSKAAALGVACEGNGENNWGKGKAALLLSSVLRLFKGGAAVLAGTPSLKKPDKSGAHTRPAQLGPRGAHTGWDLQYSPAAAASWPGGCLSRPQTPHPALGGPGWDGMGRGERSLGELERKRHGGGSGGFCADLACPTTSELGRDWARERSSPEWGG